MKPGPLWKVSVLTTEADEEAVSELLSECLAAPASSYTDLKAGKTSVTVYLQKKPALTPKWKAELRAALKEMAGPNRGRLSVRLTQLRRRDWAHSWRRHFKPLEIGTNLLIRPSWSRHKARGRQAVVTLDPGMSFGTGQHPTTAFCLKELVRLRDEDLQQSALDVGTGSGILAICAAKLGYRPVHGVDVDPVSILIAKANARRNGVAGKVRLLCNDFAQAKHRPGQQYSVVCANLIADLLLSQKDRLTGMVRPGGQLVVAGILNEEFEQIRKAFNRAGMRLARSRREKEWCSGSFRRAA